MHSIMGRITGAKLAIQTTTIALPEPLGFYEHFQNSEQTEGFLIWNWQSSFDDVVPILSMKTPTTISTGLVAYPVTVDAHTCQRINTDTYRSVQERLEDSHQNATKYLQCVNSMVLSHSRTLGQLISPRPGDYVFLGATDLRQRHPPLQARAEDTDTAIVRLLTELAMFFKSHKNLNPEPVLKIMNDQVSHLLPAPWLSISRPTGYFFTVLCCLPCSREVTATDIS
eukprot:TRINITY_DN67254_c10_g1_i2.p1 TRINITY_DN67254_c10_g1~~TRINITY_DN67254_c10_g1_i2.p1  ORF type:complete len:226 (+),score=8.89 TRINITY_DN67254_c10_g1_i2:228-905(+)